MGYRVFILTVLKGFGLDSSMPVNIPGGGVKVFVRGDEEIIHGAVEDLRKRKPDIEKVGRVEVSTVYGSFEFKPVNSEDIQFLTLNQLSKGIPAIIRMDEAVGGLGGKIGSVSSGVSKIDGVVSGLDRKYHSISLTLYAQLGVSVLILAALLYGLLVALH